MNHHEGLESLRFIEEIDRLKGIQRQTLLLDGSRRENTAEHSWHLAMAVLALAHLAEEKINVLRALRMALIHDVVEIDAGDTFVYDTAANDDKQAREVAASQRLFGLLPDPLCFEFRKDWEDFEDQNCPESRFVAGLDRLLPLIANSKTGGHSWKKHGIVKRQVIEKNQKIQKASKRLWSYAQSLVNAAVARGHLDDDSSG